ncbi:MAG: hypothetical protein ACOY3P_04995 [Planctomycetota bacterium]
MAISREELANLMRLVAHTRDREIDCDQCLMKVSEFAEQQLSNRPLPEAMRAIEQHFAVCGECREEYELLLAAMKELGRAGEGGAG